MSNWTLYNAEGEVIGAGDGEIFPQDGELLVYDADDSNLSTLEAELEATDSVYKANSLSDDALLEKKYYSAIKYLSENVRPLPFDDPSVIDPIEYPILYDEYWGTYDLVPWTPSELAAQIVKNFQEKIAAGTYKTPSMKEADRRRKKLLAEKKLAELPPPKLTDKDLLELPVNTGPDPFTSTL